MDFATRIEAYAIAAAFIGVAFLIVSTFAAFRNGKENREGTGHHE